MKRTNYIIGGEIYPITSKEQGMRIFLSSPFTPFTPQEYLSKFPEYFKQSTGKLPPSSATKSVDSLWDFLEKNKFVKKATATEVKKVGIGRVSRSKVGVSGVYDPNIFKVVFLAGGPGSGKSAVAKALFGLKGTFSYTGLKTVNSDRFFEYLLKKEGIPSDFRNMPKALFEKITEGPGSIRQRSKNLNTAQFESWLNGRLGVIIDGTGDNADKLINQAKFLKTKYGYQPLMVFVNTTLNKAIERNNKRDRKLPEKLVREIWEGSQNSLKKYKRWFGKVKDTAFVEIDNSKDVPKIEIDRKIQKIVSAFLRKPITSAKAKAWIKSELNKKKSKKISGTDSDYKLIVDLILKAKPSYDVYYNSDWNVVNVGGVGYDSGNLVKVFKAKPGTSMEIKSAFYRASKTPEKTKKEVERLSKGKIEVNISRFFVKYKYKG